MGQSHHLSNTDNMQLLLEHAVGASTSIDLTQIIHLDTGTSPQEQIKDAVFYALQYTDQARDEAIQYNTITRRGGIESRTTQGKPNFKTIIIPFYHPSTGYGFIRSKPANARKEVAFSVIACNGQNPPLITNIDQGVKDAVTKYLTTHNITSAAEASVRNVTLTVDGKPMSETGNHTATCLIDNVARAVQNPNNHTIKQNYSKKEINTLEKRLRNTLRPQSEKIALLEQVKQEKAAYEKQVVEEERQHQERIKRLQKERKELTSYNEYLSTTQADYSQRIGVSAIFSAIGIAIGIAVLTALHAVAIGTGAFVVTLLGISAYRNNQKDNAADRLETTAADLAFEENEWKKVEAKQQQNLKKWEKKVTQTEQDLGITK